MKYETVIGLEVHVELATNSKIFCSCSAHSYGAEPNTHVCPACCGMPGMLPVVNKRVVDFGMKAGMMLNCHINRTTTFDKKSYYYPDLPAAFQTTQWFSPVAVNGLVEIETSKGKKSVRIKQIHMEEDAGKLVHDIREGTTHVDFNRTSVPLIEIVSQPDLSSAEEVEAYLLRLKNLLRYAKVAECEMAHGTMRCVVNLSVRPEGATEYGVRTEIKNMNSVEAIKRAIEDAEIKPEEVDYYNAHGTSTPINDPAETQMVKLAFGDHAYKMKISSTKSMTGHCVGAAGAIEAIISIKAINDGFYPPTINLENPDLEHGCDLDYVPNKGVEGEINCIASSSLGFGGHNGCLIMKKYKA